MVRVDRILLIVGKRVCNTKDGGKVVNLGKPRPTKVAGTLLRAVR